MSSESLTREQLKFMEECNFEFCDRYTDADVEYKKIYDSGIPPPPIMHPWGGGRPRFNNRDRPGGSRHYDRNSGYDGDRSHSRYRGDRGGYDYEQRNHHRNDRDYDRRFRDREDRY